MTDREEILARIRENRNALEQARTNMLHDREVQAMTQELDAAQREMPQPSDEELEKHAYEPASADQAREVPVE